MFSAVLYTKVGPTSGIISSLPCFGKVNVSVLQGETSTHAKKGRSQELVRTALSWIWLWLWLVFPVAGQTPPALVLTPASPVEKEIPAATKINCTVLVDPDEFIRLRVDQQGIDLVVRVFSPVGKLLFEVNTTNGTQSPETVFWVAPEKGRYRIEIESSDEQTTGGRFVARILELRPATAQDRDQSQYRFAAEAALQEANRLRGSQAKADLQKALVKLADAATAFRAAHDQPGEGTVRNRIGEVNEELDEFEAAVKAYQAGRDCFTAAGDQGGIAQMLVNEGVALGDGHDQHQADLECQVKALSLVQALHDQFTEGIVLSNIGRIYLDLNEPRKALEYLLPCLKIRQEVGHQTGEVITLVNLGGAYALLEESEKALEYYFQSRDRARGLKNNNAVSYALNNIGTIYGSMGRTQRAIPYYLEALAIRRETKDKRGQISTLQSLATMYTNLKQFDKVQEIITEALEISRSIKSIRYQTMLLEQLGGVAFRQKDYQRAQELASQSLDLSRQAKDRWGESKALEKLGRVRLALGDFDQAESCFRQRLAVCEEVESQEDTMYVCGSLAQVELARGNLAQAKTYIERSVRVAEGRRALFGAQEFRSYYFEKTHRFYDLYLEILMRLHQAEPQSGFDRRAFTVSEQVKARSLLDLLRNAKVDINQKIPVALRQREQDCRIRFTAASEKVTRLKLTKAPETVLEAALAVALEASTQLRLAQAEIQKSNPAYGALLASEFITPTEVQQHVLDAETTLLQFHLAEEKSYVWVLTQNSFQTFELAGSQEIIEAAQALSASLTATSAAVRNLTKIAPAVSANESRMLSAARHLSRLILDPVKEKIECKRLVIVTDKNLAYVPFGILPVTEKTSRVAKMLIEDHEIVLAPSTMALREIRQSPINPVVDGKTVAVFADPVFSRKDRRLVPYRRKSTPEVKSDFPALEPNEPVSTRQEAAEVARSIFGTESMALPRLLGTRREAAAIARLVPAAESTFLVDFSASRASFEKLDLSQYRMLHFATHGIISQDQPEFSSLVLSLVDEKGDPQNGFVVLPEIFRLKLNASLVTLSACETGKGESVGDEGIIGFTSGFLHAGTRRVVVSLWNVSDQATAELMKRFYQGMFRDNLPPSTALRQAQLSMRAERRWRSPYFWAAFQIQGDWQ
ncbi:MAG: CHAT domain-containing protein [Blastocatellia bacterium]|nr:CHAT domain-containing protein [Blastocatellia bacterium]